MGQVTSLEEAGTVAHNPWNGLINLSTSAILATPSILLLGVDILATVMMLIALLAAMIRLRERVSVTDSAFIAGMFSVFMWMVYLFGGHNPKGLTLDFHPVTVVSATIVAFHVIIGSLNSENTEVKKFAEIIGISLLVQLFLLVALFGYENVVDEPLFIYLYAAALMLTVGSSMIGFSVTWVSDSVFRFRKTSVVTPFAVSALVIFLFLLGVQFVMVVEVMFGVPVWENGPFYCKYTAICPENRLLASLSSATGVTFSPYFPKSGQQMAFASLQSFWGFVWAIFALSIAVRRFGLFDASGSREEKDVQ